MGGLAVEAYLFCLVLFFAFHVSFFDFTSSCCEAIYPTVFVFENLPLDLHLSPVPLKSSSLVNCEEVIGLHAILASVFRNRQNSSNGGYLASLARKKSLTALQNYLLLNCLAICILVITIYNLKNKVC